MFDTTAETSVPAPDRRPASAGPVEPRHRILCAVTWLLIVVGLIVGGRWAWNTGIQLRDDLWRNTRGERDYDIGKAYNWGQQVLLYAEEKAHLQPMADALAGTPGHPPGPAMRRLTSHELMDGVITYYRHRMDQFKSTTDEVRTDTGETMPMPDYVLDYPPVRLSIMTLWVRHVQRRDPDLRMWPTSNRDPKLIVSAREDVAEPLLKLNAWSAAAGAVAAFFLACVWMRPRKRQQPYRWTVPHGLLAFALSCGAFWYCLSICIQIPLPPPPLVCLCPPEQNVRGDSVRLAAVVDNQGIYTEGYFQWGSTTLYDHRADVYRLPPAGQRDVEVSPRHYYRTEPLDGVRPGQTIHYRFVAGNVNGITKTDDATWLVGPAPVEKLTDDPEQTLWQAKFDPNRPSMPYDNFGGMDVPGWTVWLRLLVLFSIMVISARRLPAEHRGWACGVIAAMLIWFDPMVLVDSHVWPQWDVWLLPFFLWAVLAASLEWWMAAGILLGIGCMFKGQILMVSPIFILWPLFSGRLLPVLRLLVGGAFGMAVIVSPWLVSGGPWWWWIGWLTVAGLLAALWLAWPRWEWRVLLPVTASMVLLILKVDNTNDWLLAVLILAIGYGIWSLCERGWVRYVQKRLSFRISVNWPILAIVAALTIVLWRWHALSPPILGAALLLLILGIGKGIQVVMGRIWPVTPVGRWLGAINTAVVLMALAFAVGVGWCGKYHGGDFAWYELGFKYGAAKHDQMAMGERSYPNLPELLQTHFEWQLHPTPGYKTAGIAAESGLDVPAWIGRIARKLGLEPGDRPITVKLALILIYVLALLACGVAAAVHGRRRDPRLLAALCAPWVVLPIVVGQMSERYLIWASAISALMVCLSLGWTLLHVLLSLTVAAITAHQLMYGLGAPVHVRIPADPMRWPHLFELMDYFYRDGAWLLIALAALFLYAALAPGRRASPHAGAEL